MADLGDKTALILRNHGTLTVGGTVAEAFVRMWFLERACNIQVRALAGNRDVVAASQAAQDTVKQQVKDNGGMSAEMSWPALLRMLDAKYPDFRD